MPDKVYMLPNSPAPNKGMNFDAMRCNGCNQCVEVCPTDVMMPNPERRKMPIVLYPEECWFCGACVEECERDAIRMTQPLGQTISVNWQRKETGEYFRLGMKNPPPPNLRPPSGGRRRKREA